MDDKAHKPSNTKIEYTLTEAIHLFDDLKTDMTERRYPPRPIDTSLISYRIVAERIGCEPIDVLIQMFEGDIPYVCHRNSVYMTPEAFNALVQRCDRTNSEASNNSNLADRFSVTKNW